MMIPHRGGLPHSDIHGSTPARGSPWLFAACHVLLRLLVPRHPPNALLSLNNTQAPHRERPKPGTPPIRNPPPCTETIHRHRPISNPGSPINPPREPARHSKMLAQHTTQSASPARHGTRPPQPWSQNQPSPEQTPRHDKTPPTDLPTPLNTRRASTGSPTATPSQPTRSQPA